MTAGYVDIPSAIHDTWTVPYTSYMLTKVKMWKNSANVAGFEVTFTPFPAADYQNWPEQTHQFGFTDDFGFDSTETEEITLD